MSSLITVKRCQSLLDLAIQSSGSMEAAFDLAVKNEMSLTDELTPGQKLVAVPDVDSSVVQLYSVNDIWPATTLTKADSALIVEGIGHWIINIDFIVS